MHAGAPEKLIIGKFLQIAHGVQFITSSANHQMDGFSTYPFAVFGNPWAESDEVSKNQTKPIASNHSFVGKINLRCLRSNSPITNSAIQHTSSLRIIF